MNPVPALISTGRTKRTFLPTGMYSFDWLMGLPDQPGMPMRTSTELYGEPGIGKTTLAYYLSGRIRDVGRVLVIDLEDSTEEEHMISTFTRSGFIGDIEVVSHTTDKGKPIAHEMMVQTSIDRMRDDEDVNAVILDSIGVFTPIVESNNDLGDANMGIRARIIAQASRRCINALRFAPNDRSFYFINHVHPVIGGRGHITPGGKVQKYLASNRLYMYRRESFDCGTTVIEVKCEKRRYGGVIKDARGMVVIIPGIGISPEITAVMDCANMGLATRSTTVKIGDKSYGYISKILQAAADGTDPEMFLDFYNLLWPDGHSFPVFGVTEHGKEIQNEQSDSN